MMNSMDEFFCICRQLERGNDFLHKHAQYLMSSIELASGHRPMLIWNLDISIYQSLSSVYCTLFKPNEKIQTFHILTPFNCHFCHWQISHCKYHHVTYRSLSCYFLFLFYHCFLKCRTSQQSNNCGRHKAGSLFHHSCRRHKADVSTDRGAGLQRRALGLISFFAVQPHTIPEIHQHTLGNFILTLKRKG